MPDNNFSNTFWNRVKLWCPFAYQRFADSKAESIHDFYREEGIKIERYFDQESRFEIHAGGVWVGCVCDEREPSKAAVMANECAFLLLEERLTGKV